MNEIIFFSHIALLLAFIYAALKLGKNALISLSAIMVVLANLFVTKQITLFTFTITPTDAYALGCLFASNLLQEYFGKEEAKKLLHINFLLLLFFTAMAYIQISYSPSPYDVMQSSFSGILSTSPRIFLASLLCFYITTKLDIEIFGFFRKRFSLTKSMSLSLIITQLFDTIAFSFLALWGLVHSLFDIIFISYLIKMIALGTMVPFTKILRRKTA